MDPIILLIISSEENWYTIFTKSDTLANGRPIQIEQTRWKYMHVESGSREGAIVWLKKDENPLPWSSQKEDREDLKIDFFLMRNFASDLHEIQYRPLVMGLYVGRVPSVNPISTVLSCMDRPVVHAEMLRVRDRLGFDVFPMIDVIYHPNGYLGTKERLLRMDYPTVLKVGSVDAGYGKFKLESDSQYYDLEGILCMHNDFFTQEPFIEHEYEFRVQVIGEHVRCFRRNSDSGWKNNWGNVRFEEHPWDDKYEIWVDEIRSMFAGLDMFAIDVLHTSTGDDYIIELNDGAMGLWYDYEEEDCQFIKELVIQRMNEAYCPELVEKQNYIGRFVFDK